MSPCGARLPALWGPLRGAASRGLFAREKSHRWPWESSASEEDSTGGAGLAFDTSPVAPGNAERSPAFSQSCKMKV